MLSMATNYWFEELQFPIGALNFSPLYRKKKKKKHTNFEPMLPYRRRLVHFYFFFKQKLSTFPLRQQRRRRKKKKEKKKKREREKQVANSGTPLYPITPLCAKKNHSFFNIKKANHIIL
jgi:hypothetical protein